MHPLNIARQQHLLFCDFREVRIQKSIRNNFNKTIQITQNSAHVKLLGWIFIHYNPCYFYK